MVEECPRGPHSIARQPHQGRPRRPSRMTTPLRALQRRLGLRPEDRVQQLGPAGWVPVRHTLHGLQRAIGGGFAEVARRGWWTPAFRALLETPAPGLRLDNGMPRVDGLLRLRLGSNVRLAGPAILQGKRPDARDARATPLLDIGDDVEIGPDCVIAVGTLVRLGDNVRLAGRNLLAGHPGHPLDAAARAAGDGCTPDQLREIIIGAGAWLGAGAIVLGGVTIGRGTVVGAGSVVTRSLPPDVLAAGNPARVRRNLTAVNDP